MLASCPTRRPFTAARGPTAPSNYALRPKARVAVMAGVALQGKQVVVTGASQVRLGSEQDEVHVLFQQQLSFTDSRKHV